jgi:hypothetical protein
LSLHWKIAFPDVGEAAGKVAAKYVMKPLYFYVHGQNESFSKTGTTRINSAPSARPVTTRQSVVSGHGEQDVAADRGDNSASSRSPP